MTGDVGMETYVLLALLSVDIVVVRSCKPYKNE